MSKYQEALAREDSPATPADARIISRAAVPHDPSYPKKLPIVIFATLATFLGTTGWIVGGEVLSGRAIVGNNRLPRPVPRSVGARVFTRGAIEPRLDIVMADQALDKGRDAVASEAASLAKLIAAKPREYGGLCILMTGLKRQDIGSGVEIALSRRLAQTAQAIILDLDGHPANFDPLVATWSDGDRGPESLPGLTDLLCGEASFAEVIRRDDASRLHFIPAGCQESFDFADFDLVLQALSQTYDFILLTAPPLERNDMARLLAPRADVLILAANVEATDAAERVKDDLIAAGAKEIVVVDMPPMIPGERQDVA